MNESALIEAVRAGEVGRVERLIRAGADVDQQDEYGWTPMSHAAGRGDLPMVRLLAESGADVFKAGRDQRAPYKIAVAAHHVEVARYLKEAEGRVGGARAGELPYCEAYALEELRKFPRWPWREIEQKDDGGSGRPANAGVMFVHEDFTVTESVWDGRNVIPDQAEPCWKEFCRDALGFRPPDDIDLIESAGGKTERA